MYEKRLKRKMRKLFCIMLQNMTVAATIDSCHTVIFCMQKVDASKWEDLIDRLLEVLKNVEKVRKRTSRT